MDSKRNEFLSTLKGVDTTGNVARLLIITTRIDELPERLLTHPLVTVCGPFNHYVDPDRGVPHCFEVVLILDRMEGEHEERIKACLRNSDKRVKAFFGFADELLNLEGHLPQVSHPVTAPTVTRSRPSFVPATTIGRSLNELDDWVRNEIGADYRKVKKGKHAWARELFSAAFKAGFTQISERDLYRAVRSVMTSLPGSGSNDGVPSRENLVEPAPGGDEDFEEGDEGRGEEEMPEQIFEEDSPTEEDVPAVLPGGVPGTMFDPQRKGALTAWVEAHAQFGPGVVGVHEIRRLLPLAKQAGFARTSEKSLGKTFHKVKSRLREASAPEVSVSIADVPLATESCHEEKVIAAEGRNDALDGVPTYKTLTELVRAEGNFADGVRGADEGRRLYNRARTLGLRTAGPESLAAFYSLELKRRRMSAERAPP